MSTTQGPFTLEAQPGTDIWKKPPTYSVWNAPITRTTTLPLRSFSSARVTFWADWTEEYDQAGLLLVPRRPATAVSSQQPPPSPPPPPPPDQWIKTGLEFYRGVPHLSTVGCEKWADWSIGVLDMDTTKNKKKGERGGRRVTIEAVKEKDGMGESIWVYQVVKSSSSSGKEEEEGEEKKIPLREICWVFGLDKGGEKEEEEEWVLDVSPLVARPEKEGKKSGGGNLVVRFEEFVVLGT